MIDEPVKKCQKCGEIKKITEFSKDAHKKDGLTHRCKKCNAESGASWYKANKAKRSAKSAEWYASNKEKHNAISKKWYIENLDKVKADFAKRRAANPEKYKALSAKWSAMNKDKKRVHYQNRRARLKDNGGTLSKDIVKKLFDLQRGKCVCCGEALGKDFHIDHIIPIMLGGTNTDDNVQLLKSRCNHQKYIKHPIDFMQERGFLL